MSKIHGEYWFTDSGVWFADGDIGDFNHSGYAMDHARRLFLSEIGADDIDEAHDEAFHEAIDELLDEEEIDGDSREERLTKLANFDADLYAACYDLEGDVREYAMRVWGWKWCKGMWVGTHHLHKEDFDKICEGLLEAEDQDGVEIPDDLEVEIAVASTGKRYLVEWKEIKAENYLSVMGGETPIVPDKCAAVEAMDRESMSPFYKGKVGG